MKMSELYRIIFEGNLAVIQWLQARGLLKTSMRCSERRCRAIMQLRIRTDSIDGYHWKCQSARCKKTKSIRVGSFFCNSNLSLGDVLQIIYCWSVGMSMSTTSTILDISQTTIVDWYNLLREECSSKLLRLQQAEKMLGGAGQVVEIDESLMIKRKYHRGGVRQQHREWVFGMYDRTTKRGWIKFVPRRDEETLLPIIKEFVLPGTTIHSDGWGAYNNLGNNGYEHRRVIHEENFVDPQTGVHTQGVEAYWSRAKHKIKAVYGSRLSLVPSYIDEFLWRERFGKNSNESFYSILQHISEHYN